MHFGGSSIFSTSTASKYLHFTNNHLLEADIFFLLSHCLAVAKQAPCKHSIVVIFFSHKYWTSVNEGQQNKCWILTFSFCTQKLSNCHESRHRTLFQFWAYSLFNVYGFNILSPAHNHKIVSNMHTFSILGVLGIEIPAVTCISHQMQYYWS